MTRGEITLDFHLTDFVMGSGGISELSFSKPEQEPVTIMTTFDSKPGLRCEICRLLIVIDDLEQTETKCVVCKTMMPAGVTSCPKCGWTYEISAE